MHDPQIQMLLDITGQAFSKKSWHGTNLRGSIRGISLSQIQWRPQPARHSIWEHVLHAAYWKYTVRRRLLNEKKGSFPRKGSNWFTPEDLTEKGWKQDVALLVEVHTSLQTAIAELPVNKLNRFVPGSKTTTYFQLISGIAAHDVYHAGQIQLLKKLYKSDQAN